MEAISRLVEKENLKAEINALSAIRENLFEENKDAEAVVIINVQKRLNALLETSSEPVVDGRLVWEVVRRCGMTVREAETFLSNKIYRDFILESLELEKKQDSR